jgi:hypothetical protein
MLLGRSGEVAATSSMAAPPSDDPCSRKGRLRQRFAGWAGSGGEEQKGGGGGATVWGRGRRRRWRGHGSKGEAVARHGCILLDMSKPRSWVNGNWTREMMWGPPTWCASACVIRRRIDPPPYEEDFPIKNGVKKWREIFYKSVGLVKNCRMRRRNNAHSFWSVKILYSSCSQCEDVYYIWSVWTYQWLSHCNWLIW